MISNKPTLEKRTPKKKRKGLKDYFDFRNSQVNQVGLILFSAFVISTSLIAFFNERFDADRWRDLPSLRYVMLDQIIDQKLFINDSKKEIIKKLGQPNKIFSNEKDQFNYYVGETKSFSEGESIELAVIFKNNKVVKVEIVPK